MKTCKNDDSTLLSAAAEASDAQNSNAASHARRSRRLRHAGDAGKSINGSWRFKLTPALIAILFGILSALLFPSTARSQTVEELQQQISQLQTQISDLQAEKNGDQTEIDLVAQRKAELECELYSLQEEIGQLQSQMSWAVLEEQQEERNQIARDSNNDQIYKEALLGSLCNLDPDSPTYNADYDEINNKILQVDADEEARQERLRQLDSIYRAAQIQDDALDEVIGSKYDQISDIQPQIDNDQNIIDVDNADIFRIDREIQSLQDQINDLQCQIEALNNM